MGNISSCDESKSVQTAVPNAKKKAMSNFLNRINPLAITSDKRWQARAEWRKVEKIRADMKKTISNAKQDLEKKKSSKVNATTNSKSANTKIINSNTATPVSTNIGKTSNTNKIITKPNSNISSMGNSQQENVKSSNANTTSNKKQNNGNL